MTVKLNKALKDKLYNVATQLQLTTNWEKNTELISQLLGKYAPEVQLAIYWTQTGDPVYFSSHAKKVFEPYITSLKRGDLVQSAQLEPLEFKEDDKGEDNCYRMALKLSGQFLGLILVHLSDEVNFGFVQQLIDLLAPHLSIARYATEMAEEVEKRTSSDKLTGLWKRTYFNERFREETERLNRSKEVGSVAIMGLDDLAAMVRMLPPDELQSYLSAIGTTLRSLLRQTDWVVRWDDYEILFYFPNTTPESVLDVFSRCMSALLQVNPILQTVVGLCSTSETTSARGLIQLAARRLELARKDGRHRLVCFASRATGLKFWEFGTDDKEES